MSPQLNEFAKDVSAALKDILTPNQLQVIIAGVSDDDDDFRIASLITAAVDEDGGIDGSGARIAEFRIMEGVIDVAFAEGDPDMIIDRTKGTYKYAINASATVAAHMRAYFLRGILPLGSN